jgi:DNA-binding MarR family transcriptional regulator
LAVGERHDHGQSHDQQHRHHRQDVHRRAPAAAEPVVTGFYDDALRPLGLKVRQLRILIVTARLGLAQPAQVCEILQLDTSTLSRNVKPLQAHGWLEVAPDEDARAQPFRLTAQGNRLIEKAVPA